MKYYLQLPGTYGSVQATPEPLGSKRDQLLNMLRAQTKSGGSIRLHVVPESAADISLINSLPRSARKLVWHFNEVPQSKARDKQVKRWARTTIAA